MKKVAFCYMPRCLIERLHLKNVTFNWMSEEKRFSSTSNVVSKPKTGIVMMNMGGPKTLDDVQDFLVRLYTDSDLIDLPFMSKLGPYLAKRRTPMLTEKYRQIGGGSPILKWTELQGRAMVNILDKTNPATAPHKYYVAFRYVNPLTETTLEQMEKDGIERAVAFSQYPQYSCCTSGSSLNAIYKHFQSIGKPSKIKWSVIDRWPTHSGFTQTFASIIRDEIAKYPIEEQKDVIILFSAHSLPMKRVNAGDPYPIEVGASVVNVMKALNWSHPYRLVWQSKVGPVAWLRPSTNDAMTHLAKKNLHHLLIVPIAFTSDHIETLHELDIEYCHDLAKKVGLKSVRRATAPNDHPLFIKTLADLAGKHLSNEAKYSAQFPLCCPMCTKKTCSEMRKWFDQVSFTNTSSPANQINK